MKHLFVGDLHFGVNEDDLNYIKYQTDSLDWIVSKVKELNVTNVHILGDMFDNRKYLSHLSINMFNLFKNMLGDKCSIVVVGNHDCYYKNSNLLNAPKLLMDNKWVVYDDCLEFHDMIFVPWINKNNHDRICEQIKKSKKKYCVGHFELSGFKMGKGIASKHDTIDRKLLDKFDKVISGHYHSHSIRDNIVYVGTPYEINFNDEGEDKFILLLEDDEFTYLKNPLTYHKQLVIKNEDDLLEISKIKDKKVKVKLECERNIKIEKWLMELKDKVDCDIFEYKGEIVIDENIEINTMELREIWTEYINSATIQGDLNEVNRIFEEEYNKIINGVR